MNFVKPVLPLVILLVVSYACNSPSIPTKPIYELPQTIAPGIVHATSTFLAPTGTVRATVTESLSASEPELITGVCRSRYVPPIEFGSLAPASLELPEKGYAAEWFVPPNVLGMPSAVLLASDGGFYVSSMVNNQLFHISSDGTISRLAEVSGSQMDMDEQGNIYLANPGRITRVGSDGSVTELLSDQNIENACSDGFGFGPDGNLYRSCGQTNSLTQITPKGKVKDVGKNIPLMVDLHSTPEGRLLGAAAPNRIYEITLEDFSITLIAEVPGEITSGGLAVDDQGYVYIATGATTSRGSIYRFLPGTSRMTHFATVPGSGLSGIQWLAESSEIVGAQERHGGVMAVNGSAIYREIVAGNGLFSPTELAFSPCGCLAIANREPGVLTLADPAGNVSWIGEYRSSNSQHALLVYAPDGTLYASESQPYRNAHQLSRISPTQTELEEVAKFDMIGGMVRRSDGSLLLAETSAGRIFQLNADGTSQVFVDGLQYPQAMVLDKQENIYVVTGGIPSTSTISSTEAIVGDTVTHISVEGRKSTFSHVAGITDLVFSPAGELFASANNNLVRFDTHGEPFLFTGGFAQINGLAFDLGGNLYVSDEGSNAIARIAGFPQGRLNVKVIDENGAAVPYARIQILAESPVVVGQVIFSDANGFLTSQIAPRRYTINVTSAGFEAATLGCEVIADQETTIEIQLIKAR